MVLCCVRDPAGQRSEKCVHLHGCVSCMSGGGGGGGLAGGGGSGFWAVSSSGLEAG